MTTSEPFTPEQVHAIASACETPRDRALILLMDAIGSRVGETLAIELQDLARDDDGWRIWIRHPKGWARKGNPAAPRRLAVPLATPAATALELWIKDRGLVPGPLFLTHTGKAVQSAYVRRKIPEWGRAAGLTRRCHAHAFRHGFAWRHRKDVFFVQKVLGHSSLGTTSTYLAGLGADVTDLMLGNTGGQ